MRYEYGNPAGPVTEDAAHQETNSVTPAPRLWLGCFFNHWEKPVGNKIEFEVLAGKYDGDEENCKYANSFDTLDEAIVDIERVRDYPWSRIVYCGIDHTRFIVDAYPEPKHLR